MNANLQPDLESIIRARDFPALRGRLEDWSPTELVSLIVGLAVEDQVIVFRILPRKTAATVFEHLDLDAQEKLLKAMAQQDVATLLNDMAPDDRTRLLEELPASVTKQMLALLTAEERAVAVLLLGYPESSIGRLMTPDYVMVREAWTVERVLGHIRRYGQDSETLSTIYVVNESVLMSSPFAPAWLIQAGDCPREGLSPYRAVSRYGSSLRTYPAEQRLSIWVYSHCAL
ncbi:MAG: magnesium transporter MgtE N-terminal domain-containing protein [Opitutaceae bacterium]